MRIISKFKDYYDSAAGYGVDTTVVFNRTSQVLPSQSVLATEQDAVRQQREILAACLDIIHPDRFKNLFRSHVPYDQPIFVGVAGKIYVGLNLHLHINDPKKTLFKPIRWGDQLDDLYVWQPSNLTAEQLATKTKALWIENPADTVGQWFEVNNRVVENLDLFTKYNMVSFAVRRTQGSHEYVVELNPCLRELGFQRFVDGYTLFQEISMFVTGVLAQKDQMTYVPTDKELLYARGHDDMSFKTPPTKRK